MINASLKELSVALAQKKISAVELATLFLDRIDQLNPEINAILYLRPRAELMDEARACDRELADGHSRGWMHGFPQAVKDLSEVKGMPCSWGSPIFKGFVSTVDSIHVERVRQAGAIFIGRRPKPCRSG